MPVSQHDLHDPDPYVRLQAVRALGNGESLESRTTLGGSATVQQIGPLLSAAESDPLVRSEAAWALGRLASNSTVTALSHALLTDPDATVRSDAAMALGELAIQGGSRALIELQKALEHETEEMVQLDIIRAIGRLIGQSRRQTLGRKDLDDPQEILRTFLATRSASSAIYRAAQTYVDQWAQRPSGDCAWGHTDEIVRWAQSSNQTCQMAMLLQIEMDTDSILHGIHTAGLGAYPRHYVQTAIVRWANTFNIACEPSSGQRAVVVGTTANIDVICWLSQTMLDQAIEEAALADEWLASQQGNGTLEQALDYAVATYSQQRRATPASRMRVIQQAIALAQQTTDSGSDLASPVEIIGCLVRGAKGNAGSEGKKPFVLYHCLITWIEHLFGSDGVQQIGGASAIINNQLAHYGEKCVALVTSDFPPALAQLHDKQAQIAEWDGSSNKICLYAAHKTTRYNDAVKTHYAVEWATHEQLCCGNLTFITEQADRVIFRTRRPWNEQRRAWSDRNWQPGLGYCGFRDNAIDSLSQKWDGAIFSGLQFAANDQRLCATVKDELDRLLKGGVKLHIEISGSVRNAFDFVNAMLQGRVSSLGVGEEFIPMMRELKVSPSTSIPDQANPIYCEYLYGVSLFEYMPHLKRLYIHRATADLILRRKMSTQDDLANALESEIVGNLRAKNATVRWVYGEGAGHSIPPTTGMLRWEGIRDVFDLAFHLANSRGLQGRAREDFVAMLSKRGYDIPSQHEGSVGVAVVPVKWSYGFDRLSVTGAGDLSSGCSFVWGFLGH